MREGQNMDPAAFWNGRSRRFRSLLVLLVVLVGLTALLVPVSLQRLIDGDEGYLLIAARLVSEGNVPYRDFFLTQGPLLPAFFGVYFWGVGRSWFGARLLAGFIAIVMGLLVYRESLSATRRRVAAVFATALFAFSGVALGWLTIVKSFGLCALCLLLSTCLIGIAVRPPKPHHRHDYNALTLAGAGVLLGLAASTRLYALVAMPTLVIYIVYKLGLNRPSARRLGYYALGCLLGLLPLIASYAVNSRAFLFDTLLFHAVREYGQDSLFGKPDEKVPAVLKALGLHAEASKGGRQLMGMAIAATLALFARIASRNSWCSAAACLWPVLLAASALPNPFFAQYLCLLVPFLAIEGGIFLAMLCDLCQKRRSRLGSFGLAVCTLAYLTYHVSVGWMERNRYLCTGNGVPGIQSGDRVARWRIDTIEAAAKEIDALNIPVAASWWPGYFVSSRTSIATVLANDFGFRAADVLSPDERRRLHVATLSDVGEMIQRRNPRLFVEGNWAAYPWVNWLPQNGYQVRRTIDNVRLWTAE